MKGLKTVDCRGLACPKPVINTRDALQGSTAPILVIVDDDGACTNVRRFAESQGAKVVVDQNGNEFHLTIEPGQNVRAESEPQIICSTSANMNMVVYVSSEGMGSGDSGLGSKLMVGFLDTLSQFKDELSHVIFINAGAKLVVEGSSVLEHVRQLEQLGVEVLTCGTCLSHFGIKDKLAVGRVSNMYEIIETLSLAGRILRP